MQTIKKTKTIEHPLEEAFDLTPGTTVVEYTENVPAEVVAMPDYDDKDQEIEQKLEEIYTMAIGNAGTISDEIEVVEGKYKARMGEVTATMLNVALGAVREKRELKVHKDKMFVDTTAAGTPRTVNNNLVVTADRNELMRMLLDKQAQSNK